MKRFTAFVVCLTLAGLTYVYGEVEAVKIGYTIRKQQEARAQSLDRSRALQYNIARLKSPRNLERRLEAQKIELESPKQWQTLVMPGAAGTLKRPAVGQVPGRPLPPLGRFFIGTAQAEAKES